MNYRYLQFVDRGLHNGNIYYVIIKPADEFIEELGLEPVYYNENTLKGYSTTLQNMADHGWTLKFVTPCGLSIGGSSHMIKGGPIENSYIFVKSE